jgi:hypothetical protein
MNVWTSEYKSHQGNFGLGRAIAYYTSKGYPVNLPLNDTQKYDLIVDINGSLKRVSVKTTQYKHKHSNYYTVHLKNCGGAGGKHIIRNFDNSTCDIVFIATVADELYEIPANEILVKTGLTLTSKWDKYKTKL